MSSRQKTQNLPIRIVLGALIAALPMNVAAVAEPPPSLPKEPLLDVDMYPNCQKEWITTIGADRNAKIQLIVSCIDKLEGYNQTYLRHFTLSVRNYSNQLTLEDSLYHHSGATAAQITLFSQEIQKHLDRFKSKDSAGDFGDGYQPYYDYLQRYKADVRALTVAYRDIVNSS